MGRFFNDEQLAEMVGDYRTSPVTEGEVALSKSIRIQFRRAVRANCW
jgi:hypothetical protein